jgi:hypothetical protein
MRPSTLNAGQLAALRPIERASISPTGRIEFRIQRPLKNANGRNRNPHWSTKHAGRQAWQTSLCNALVLSIGYPAACQLLVDESGLAGARGTRVQTRRRIEIIRLAPSTRNFIKDSFDNLHSSAKELRDAIKHLGVIRDDSDKWTDTVIDQALSSDGTWWTWIAIDNPKETTA